jgi:hypothetical protein
LRRPNLGWLALEWRCVQKLSFGKSVCQPETSLHRKYDRVDQEMNPMVKCIYCADGSADLHCSESFAAGETQQVADTFERSLQLAARSE